MSDANDQATESTPQPKLPLRQRLIGTLAAFLGTGTAALLVHLFFYNLPNATSAHQEFLGLHPVIMSGLYVLLGAGGYAWSVSSGPSRFHKDPHKVNPYRTERFATVFFPAVAMLLMLDSFGYRSAFNLTLGTWSLFLYAAILLACSVSSIVKSTFGKQYRWLPLMSKFLQDGN